MARNQSSDQRSQRAAPASRPKGPTATGVTARRSEREISRLETVARRSSAPLLEPTHRLLRGR
jgi:hypothetical protein